MAMMDNGGGEKCEGEVETEWESGLDGRWMLKLMSGVGGLGNPQAFIAAVVLCEHAATLAKAKAEVDTKLHVATSPVFQTS